MRVYAGHLSIILDICLVVEVAHCLAYAVCNGSLWTGYALWNPARTEMFPFFHGTLQAGFALS